MPCTCRPRLNDSRSRLGFRVRGADVLKSVRPGRMAENLDVFDLTLTDAEMARIATLDAGTTLFFDHRDPAMVSQIGNRRIHD